MDIVKKRIIVEEEERRVSQSHGGLQQLELPALSVTGAVCPGPLQ